jgi:flagellar motility protein MotE (MotC chaperone)
MPFIRGIDMRRIFSNFTLIIAILVLAMPVLTMSSRVLAQEPEAAVQRRNLAAPGQHQQPKPRKPLKPHAKAGTSEGRAIAHATPGEAPNQEATDGPMVQDAGRNETGQAVAEKPASQQQTLPPEVQQFCGNNAAAAGQARVAWEAGKLKELETKLRQRIAELEAKRAEYEEWLRKREEALKKAGENVVAIYTRMRPDAAALQLAAMDDDMAAAVLAKLKPSNASAILNEMEPGRAARLAATMAGLNAADGKKT